MTLAEYNKRFDDQNGLCMICGNGPEGRGKNDRLVVDHDHRTDEIRGLICGRCNVALGLVDDNISTLQAMITYLKKET